MRLFSKVAVIGLMTVMVLVGCGAPAATTEGKVIATVNGEKIFEDVFDEWYMRTMALSLGLDMTQEMDEQTKAFIDSYRLSYLSSYTGQRALVQEAEKAGVTVEDQEIDEYVANLQASYGEDDAGFEEILKTMGFTRSTIRDYIQEQMMIQGLYEIKTADVTEGEITPREYYDQNPREFQIPESRDVRHILVEKEEEALELIAAIESGEDFSALAKEKSLDPGSKDQGGAILGVAQNGSYVEPFETATFALKEIGELTKAPVATDYGFHVIILDAIHEGSTRSFADVEAAISNELIWQAKDALFEAYYNTVVEDSEISYEKGFDPMAASGAQ